MAESGATSLGVFQFCQARVDDRVGWLEYNQPPLNAFNWEMLDELARALAALLAAPDARVIVFASAVARYFSTGADIRVLQAMSQSDMREWVTRCHGFVLQMRRATKPLLAAINGIAVGAGLKLVLHCDVRFAAEDARLGQLEINIGFTPPVGTTQALVRLMGRPAALKFLYDGALLPATQARSIGLVDVVVPPDRLRADVQQYAASLAGKSATGLAAIRRCITEGVDLPFEQGLALELEAAVDLAGTPDFIEGLAAFVEKRQPRWT